MRDADGTKVKTTCAYCGVGCGVIARVETSGAVTVEGDKDHPANFGRLCSKGINLAETIDLEGRLLHPEIWGRRANWSDALDLIANKFRSAIREHGPDSVAIYASGQLLTEDYYVANKLMKGFIGAANIDTNSRLCMASTVAGHKRAFGSDTVPGNYEDLELCDMLVLVGSNLAWCHPVLFQRVKAAKENRPEMKVVLIDPRKTATAEIADLHLAINADGDAALFNALFSYLVMTDNHDVPYIEHHTNGFQDALKACSPFNLADLSRQTGLEKDDIIAFFDLFNSTEKTVSVFSQGVNQSTAGTDKVNAIINCHLITGRIGKPGRGPFSVTGQPNAMGGREVGGLANQLAAHMDIGNADHRALLKEFWKSSDIAQTAGLKAVELFQALSDGKIKALWILATNPADSMPNADFVQAALQNCEFLVASDILKATDTMRHAHVKLPSLGWGEKTGTVTNSERRISLQKSFLSAPGEAKADWWQIAEVGRKMGYEEAFSYSCPADIFREHATLSGYKNKGTRDFDISGKASLTNAEYDGLTPFQWPFSTYAKKSRFFEDGKFHTKSGKANIVSVRMPLVSERSQKNWLILNTGRVRDHWHTMTRTGKSPKLSMHLAEPFVEIHPLDAHAYGLEKADLAMIKNDFGRVIARVVLTERVKPSTVFIPMHWTDQFSSEGRVDVLVNSNTDPYSGQPGFKKNNVTVSKFKAKYFAFSISIKDPVLSNVSYWAKARCTGGWQTELAYEDEVPDWRKAAMDVWGVADEKDVEILCYEDKQRNAWRFAGFQGSKLIGAFFIARSPVEVSRYWAAKKLVENFERTQEKILVLAGRPGADIPDKGPIICSCFDVGAFQISKAIDAGCQTVDGVGKDLSAGTNCGSCRSEIQNILNLHLSDLVAAE